MNRETESIGVSQVVLHLPAGRPARVWYAAAADNSILRADLLGRILERSALCGRQGMRSIRVEYGRLGRPFIRASGPAEIGVSFSHLSGRLWAAVSDVNGVGIDASHPGEFTGGYPLARIAESAELAVATRLTGTSASAAALLWAVKEAAVKASGQGFHRVDFRDVTCGMPVVRETGFFFPARAGRRAAVWADRQGAAWVAVAAAASRP